MRRVETAFLAFLENVSYPSNALAYSSPLLHWPERVSCHVTDSPALRANPCGQRDEMCRWVLGTGVGTPGAQVRAIPPILHGRELRVLSRRERGRCKRGGRRLSLALMFCGCRSPDSTVRLHHHMILGSMKVRGLLAARLMESVLLRKFSSFWDFFKGKNILFVCIKCK